MTEEIKKDEEKDPFKELLQKIGEVVQEAINLKITTVVGEVKDDKNFTVVNPKTMYTKIDLVQGDIVSKIDEAYVTGNLTELRTYHQGRESQANKIIEDNIKTLEKLVDYVQKLSAKQEANE